MLSDWSDEREQAESLLHETYVAEQGWLPAMDNPSGLQVKHLGNGKQVLSDAFSGEAFWFGAFCGDRLIGTFRVLPPNQLEAIRYTKLPSFIDPKNSAELNRLAIAKAWRRNHCVMLGLQRVAFDFAFSIARIVYTSAANPNPSNLFQKLGLRQAGLQFRYHHTDPKEVDLLYGDSEVHDRYQTPLYRLSERMMHR